jgi:hypothetical protein
MYSNYILHRRNQHISYRYITTRVSGSGRQERVLEEETLRSEILVSETRTPSYALQYDGGFGELMQDLVRKFKLGQFRHVEKGGKS